MILVVLDSLRWLETVVEEGRRQCGRPLLLVEWRIGGAEDGKHAPHLHHLFVVSVEIHDVVGVDEVHGQKPGLGWAISGARFLSHEQPRPRSSGPC